MGKKRFDPQQIRAMYNTGFFSTNDIAKRLGASHRTVKRAVSGYKFSHDYSDGIMRFKDCGLDEHKMWQHYYSEEFFQVSSIAFHFGVSVQAVHKVLKERGVLDNA
jgi:DNA invertase Pin-like site-specific DNA recombinase